MPDSSPSATLPPQQPSLKLQAGRASSALILADRQPAQLTQLSRPRRSLAPISNLVSPCLASRSAASPPFWQHRRQLRRQLSLPQLPALLGSIATPFSPPTAQFRHPAPHSTPAERHATTLLQVTLLQPEVTAPNLTEPSGVTNQGASVLNDGTLSPTPAHTLSQSSSQPESYALGRQPGPG